MHEIHEKGRFIIEKARKVYPNFEKQFGICYENSAQAIIFGSYAFGCENSRSDIDILFVGGERRRLDKWLDFIWLRPEQVRSKNWLGSELATHLAKYGIWLKGEDNWKYDVFFSQAAITRKKEKIFSRLIHILIKKERLSSASKRELLIKVLINCHRLILLRRQIHIPPTAISAHIINESSCNLLTEMIQDDWLGPTFGTIMHELFPQCSLDKLYHDLKGQILNKYELNNPVAHLGHVTKACDRRAGHANDLISKGTC